MPPARGPKRQALFAGDFSGDWGSFWGSPPRKSFNYAGLRAILGLPARTRTWNHRLGGGSYILFNYRENASFYPKVLVALLNAALGLRLMRPRCVKGIGSPLARYL